MEREYKISFINFFRHLHTVNVHRWRVFILCCKVGIPIQGLLHDLSKYSYTEFWESVKYYQGNYSPITNCKKENGYSKAWLHHKGRNKHHYEYWYDSTAPEKCPIIPFKYVLEMICDTFAAGMTYEGKKWTNDSQLKYWHKTKEKATINPKIANMLERVYTEVSKNGLKEVMKKSYLKELYDFYTK